MHLGILLENYDGGVRNFVINFCIFQSPFKYVATVVSVSFVSKIHRFLQFELNEDRNNYKLSKLMGNPAYIRFNAYWEEIAVTGFIPLFILIYLNLKIYLKVR